MKLLKRTLTGLQRDPDFTYFTVTRALFELFEEQGIPVAAN